MATFRADTIKGPQKTNSGWLGHKSLQRTDISLHSIEKSQKEAVNSIDGEFSSEGILPSF